MISFSILLNCHQLSAADCLSFLGIAPEDVATYEDPAPQFLEGKRNGALVSTAAGDFTHAVDVFLHEQQPAALESQLSEMSAHGVDIAMPVSDDPDPEVCWYWRMGRRRLLRVVDFDGELKVLDPLATQGIE